MEHRQFGYVLGIVVGGGGALVIADCSLGHWDMNGNCLDRNFNGKCDIYEGGGGSGAGSGGTTSSIGGGGADGVGGIIATGGGGAGGTGGAIATGGGGSSVGGSPTGGAGGSPTGGSAGAGGTGGQGGGLPPVLCGPQQIPISSSGLVVCWYLGPAHHPPGTTLGLGGLIKEPGNPVVAQSPFPGCVTSNASEDTLVCPFGSLAVGTDFTFDPYATDGATTFWRCDQKGFPTSKCFGEYWVYVDGVEVAYFIDPPTGRWSYDTAGAYLRLVYTDPG